MNITYNEQKYVGKYLVLTDTVEKAATAGDIGVQV
jgi:hypothetical protein